MAKHVLVTGINGFVGKHLAKTLYNQGHKVSGVGNESALSSGLQTFISNWITCDLADLKKVRKLDLSPYDGIISLAGLADIGKSFEQSRSI